MSKGFANNDSNSSYVFQRKTDELKMSYHNLYLSVRLELDNNKMKSVETVVYSPEELSKTSLYQEKSGFQFSNNTFGMTKISKGEVLAKINTNNILDNNILF